MGNKINKRRKKGSALNRRRLAILMQARHQLKLRRGSEVVSSKIGDNNLCYLPPESDQIRLRQDIFIQPQLPASICYSIKTNENTEQIEGDDTNILMIEKDTEEDQLQCPQDSVPDESNVTPELKPAISRLRARPEKKPHVSVPTIKQRIREAREKRKETQRRCKEAAADLKEEIQRRRKEAAADLKKSKLAKKAMLTDECQVYANTLAIALRRYPERTRTLLKNRISNLIMFADSGYDQLAKYVAPSLQRASPIIYETESTADDELNLTEVDDKTQLILFYNNSVPVLENDAQP